MRIAGVDVGKVSSVAREGNAGLVTMEIESSGLPIHSDATVKIRPRTFLEGNWFVELQPGSPSAKALSSGATLPITQTADPVQLDQVLDALNTETRANLQNFLIGYGDGLTRKPDAAENAEQDPELRRPERGAGAQQGLPARPASLRGAAVLNQAITGTEPDDLSKLVASIGKVTAALNVHEQQLGELIVNFKRVLPLVRAPVRVPAARPSRELPGSLTAINQGFAALSAALPPSRDFALDIVPGVKATPATVAAQLPWIEQVKASLAPSELGGVAEGLAEAAPCVASLQSEQIPFQQQSDLLSKCQTNLIFPAGNTKLQDGASTSGVEDYKEFWYSLVGPELARPELRRQRRRSRTSCCRAAARRCARRRCRSSARTCRACICSPTRRCHRSARARPTPPTSRRISRNVPCYTQTLPNFNGPLSQGPADGSGG